MSHTPTWSVMIPAYHCNDFLPRCLSSVLDQDPGPAHLQLVVVNDDPADPACANVVETHGRGRAECHRNERNLGAGGNFNRCLALARGELVLVLHGDCYLLPGFFEKLLALARAHPAAGMVACRAVGVDEHDGHLWDSHRYPEFETLNRDDTPIWRELHLMPSAVVVRREVYAALGGYREDIANGQDWEMWGRVIRARGIVMVPEILAAYRQHADSITARTKRSAQNIREFARLYEHFASTRPNYPLQEMMRGLSGIAYSQARQFAALGDREAWLENRRAWREVTPRHLQLWSNFKDAGKTLLRREP